MCPWLRKIESGATERGGIFTTFPLFNLLEAYHLQSSLCLIFWKQHLQETLLPHAWKGGIGCMVVGLAIMVLTVLLSILTPCFRHCCCCSVFTFSGSLQVFSLTVPTVNASMFAQYFCSTLGRDPLYILKGFWQVVCTRAAMPAPNSASRMRSRRPE